MTKKIYEFPLHIIVLKYATQYKGVVLPDFYRDEVLSKSRGLLKYSYAQITFNHDGGDLCLKFYEESNTTIQERKRDTIEELLKEMEPMDIGQFARRTPDFLRNFTNAILSGGSNLGGVNDELKTYLHEMRQAAKEGNEVYYLRKKSKASYTRIIGKVILPFSRRGILTPIGGQPKKKPKKKSSNYFSIIFP